MRASLPLVMRAITITPMRTGYRIGSTMEFAGYDATLDRGRLDILRRGAEQYLQEPFGEAVQNRPGLVPMRQVLVPAATQFGDPVEVGVGGRRVEQHVAVLAAGPQVGVLLVPDPGRAEQEGSHRRRRA